MHKKLFNRLTATLLSSESFLSHFINFTPIDRQRCFIN